LINRFPGKIGLRDTTQNFKIMVASTLTQTELFPTLKDEVKTYSLDRQKLLQFKRSKIVDKVFYVYMAILLTFESLDVDIDVEDFCDEWEISESEFASAVATLQKKKALTSNTGTVQLELFEL